MSIYNIRDNILTMTITRIFLRTWQETLCGLLWLRTLFLLLLHVDCLQLLRIHAPCLRDTEVWHDDSKATDKCTGQEWSSDTTDWEKSWECLDIITVRRILEESVRTYLDWEEDCYWSEKGSDGGCTSSDSALTLKITSFLRVYNWSISLLGNSSPKRINGTGPNPQAYPNVMKMQDRTGMRL